MRNILFAAVAALAVTTGSSAYAQTGPASDQPAYSSAAALNALLADWSRIGFSTPSKPAQYRVYGRDGHVTNGPDYNAMVTLIRLALDDSREGRDQAALAKVAKVRNLLDR
ncbi:MAG: hypothetical protein B7Z80_03340 [Rhodospirillales bacterium 20-64-7]|nr:MAG: hypothetical protein B7Z80_03340 [Rhodospirillales bacterium 20-64-7]